MGVDEAGQEELAVLELDKVDGPKHAMALEGILDLVRVDVALERGDVAGMAGDGEEGAREGPERTLADPLWKRRRRSLRAMRAMYRKASS